MRVPSKAPHLVVIIDICRRVCNRIATICTMKKVIIKYWGVDILEDSILEPDV